MAIMPWVGLLELGSGASARLTLLCCQSLVYKSIALHVKARWQLKNEKLYKTNPAPCAPPITGLLSQTANEVLIFTFVFRVQNQAEVQTGSC